MLCLWVGVVLLRAAVLLDGLSRTHTDLIFHATVLPVVVKPSNRQLAQPTQRLSTTIMGNEDNSYAIYI
jgi:hypothetical protein